MPNSNLLYQSYDRNDNFVIILLLLSLKFPIFKNIFCENTYVSKVKVMLNFKFLALTAENKTEFKTI